ncbi:DUF559 domain-containing protein [Candidatus Peregrinibacteria bacterium]|nr:DUF559 domain-containing protein [Candidatus Peregrinibacteria bacterium]
MNPDRKPFNLVGTKQWRRTLRTHMPKAEHLLWAEVRGDKMGCRFFRQYGVGQYSLDFYCPTFRLAIEVDGESHKEKNAQERDRKRDKYMQAFDMKTVRISNLEIYENLEGVVERLKGLLKSRQSHPRNLSPSP